MTPPQKEEPIRVLGRLRDGIKIGLQVMLYFRASSLILLAPPYCAFHQTLFTYCHEISWLCHLQYNIHLLQRDIVTMCLEILSIAEPCLLNLGHLWEGHQTVFTCTPGPMQD